jgi:hypothetical protein
VFALGAKPAGVAGTGGAKPAGVAGTRDR